MTKICTTKTPQQEILEFHCGALCVVWYRYEEQLCWGAGGAVLVELVFGDKMILMLLCVGNSRWN